MAKDAKTKKAGSKANPAKAGHDLLDLDTESSQPFNESP